MVWNIAAFEPKTGALGNHLQSFISAVNMTYCHKGFNCESDMPHGVMVNQPPQQL
jgi:hypothetical protein